MGEGTGKDTKMVFMNLIPIYKPFLPKKSKKYALKALEDGWLTNHTYNIEVEEMLQDIMGAKHVLLTCNGTAATHLVAKGLKYKHPEINNIFVPNIVYVAAWNSFLFDKEFDLLQTETDIYTWNLYKEGLSKRMGDKKSNYAILAVHNLGNPVDTPKLTEEMGIPVVEDACEAFGGKYSNGKWAGTGGLISSLSFFGNKTITSGEGGAIVTDDDDIAQYLERLRGQGQTSTRYIHDLLGYNYRMTNVQAAILRGQLDYLEEIFDRKSEIWHRYDLAFRNNDNIDLQRVEEGCQHSRWMYGISI
jgi:perosamine synthetase